MATEPITICLMRGPQKIRPLPQCERAKSRIGSNVNKPTKTLRVAGLRKTSPQHLHGQRICPTVVIDPVHWALCSPHGLTPTRAQPLKRHWHYRRAKHAITPSVHSPANGPKL